MADADLVLYHGARRWEGPVEVRPARKGRTEHGPGLYLTTRYETARKYGKVLRVTIRGDVRWLEDAALPLDETLEFVAKGLPRFGKRRALAEDLRTSAARMAVRLGPNAVPASVLVNLLVNDDGLSGANGPAVAGFLVRHGIDASLTGPAFGSFGGHSEQWVVVFNPEVVLSVKPLSRSDSTGDMPAVQRRETPKPNTNAERRAPTPQYRPDPGAPEAGAWDRSGPEPRWRQEHRALVAHALRSWKGSPAEMKLHLRDVDAGAAIPSSGTGKLMRAMAEALRWELGHNAKATARPLYRGSHERPVGVQSWSSRQSVAQAWAGKNSGRVWIAPRGIRGLRIADYTSSAFDSESEWLLDHDVTEVGA